MKNLINISLFLLLAIGQPFMSIAQDATSSVVTISGSGPVAVGSITAFADANEGGRWSSSNTAVATVNKDGIVTGVATGNVNISYTYAAEDFSLVIDVATVAVSAAPAASGMATSAASVFTGATTVLVDKNTDGMWSSSDMSVATVSQNGIVTGVTTGTATISYAYVNTDFTLVIDTATVKVVTADNDYKVATK